MKAAVKTLDAGSAGEVELNDAIFGLEPRRDLTFVDDTVRAFVLAIDRPGIEGQVLHFGQGSAVSVHVARTTSVNNRLIVSSPVARPMGPDARL